MHARTSSSIAGRAAVDAVATPRTPNSRRLTRWLFLASHDAGCRQHSARVSAAAVPSPARHDIDRRRHVGNDRRERRIRICVPMHLQNTDSRGVPVRSPQTCDGSAAFLDGRALASDHAAAIAACTRTPRAPRPGLMWLGGFKSDMGGTKAMALDAWAAEQGRACLRFDYSGHGESGGAFADGTISRWLDGKPCGIRRLLRGPQSAGGLVDGRLDRAAARARTRAARNAADAPSPAWC